MRRVVVTGMGAVTPLGLNVEEFWTGLKEGKTAFGEITKFDTTEYKVHLAAEVKGFQGKDYMDFKAAKRMELFCQYAVAAAKEAMEQAGICMENEDPYRVGCSIGSGIGSLQTIEREHKKLLEKGPARVNPLMVPLMISNMAAGNVSIQFGLKGKSINVVTACASGTHCIGEAFRTIQVGDASWRQEVQKPALHRWELQDFLLLPPFLLQKIRKDVPFLLTKKETDLSWEKAQA